MTNKREIRLSCVMSDDGGFAIYDVDDYTNYSRPLSVCHPTGPAADWLRECMTSQERRKSEKLDQPSTLLTGTPTPAAEPPAAPSFEPVPDHIAEDQAALQEQSATINKAWQDL